MQKNRQAEFRRGPGTRVSKYFALGRRRISKAPLFNANCTGICRRGKKNYFVRFIPCRTHPLTPKIHFWRLAKIKPCTAVSPLHPTSFSFFFFFHLSKNFLIFFIYPSKEILRTRFVASFRFVLFLSRQWCGWKFSIAFLQFTEAAIRCVGFGDFQFTGRGRKEYGWTKVSLIEKTLVR